MALLHIAFQDGFSDDTVVALVNGEEVFRKTGVTTRLQVGHADSFEVTVEGGPVDIRILLPLKDLSEVIQVQVAAATYVGVSIERGKIVRRVALHASLALGNEVAREYKQLVEDKKEPRKQLGIKILPAQPEEARKLLDTALTAQMATAVETIGHIEFKNQVDRFSDLLAAQDEFNEAAKTQDALLKTMSARKLRGRGILPQVLRGIEGRRDGYRKKERKGSGKK